MISSVEVPRIVQEKTYKSANKDTKQIKRMKKSIENNFQKLLISSLKIVREINLVFVKTSYAF